MTQLAAPLIPDLTDLTDDLAPSQLRVAAPAARTTSLRRRVRVAPLIHLLVAAATVLALPPVGVHVEPELALGLVLAWPLALYAAGCYTARPLADAACSQVGRVVRAGAGLGLASWVVAAVAGPLAAPQVLLPATVALTGATVVVTVVACRARRRATRLVLVGSPDDVAAAMTELARSTQPFEVTAACLTRQPGENAADLPATLHVGTQGAARVAAECHADAMVVVPGAELPPAHVRRLEWDAERNHTEVYVGTGLLDVAPSRTSTLQAGGMDVVHVRPAASRGPRRILKGLAERTAAATALLLLLPALLAICVAVRRDSPGPAIFRQQRVGRDGRLFTMYKFRTMGCSAERDIEELADRNDADGVLFKLRQDPRITRIGALLRKYSIDEVPQLWNVVNGSMALVGPRPALPNEVAQYDVDPRRRLAVRPGLTGLWQVSGRSDLSWQESVRLDVQYVDNWSLALDVSIVLRTARAVLTHRGAY